MSQLILAINPGNTSTKVGLFDLEKSIFVENIKHSDEELAPFADINSQIDFRAEVIGRFLDTRQIRITDLQAVAARGGLLKPLASGTYLVDAAMLADLVAARRGSHASNIAAQIGNSIASRAGIPCYIVDPVSVDELAPIARYTGHTLFERISLTHALNMKAVAKRHCKEKGLTYGFETLIVIHLGTGVSLSIHTGGRMVDIVNPSEEGAFSLDRSGSLPVLQVARYIIENRLSYPEFEKMVFGNGGVFSYLASKDFFKIEESYFKGEPRTVEVVDAMAYQIAKEAAGLAAVVDGKVNAILITGGMAHARFFREMIMKRIAFIAPMHVYPGEDEMVALAEGVSRVLLREETAKTY